MFRPRQFALLLAIALFAGCSNSGSDPSIPSNLSYGENPVAYVLNMTIPPNEPTVTGDALEYQITPAPPDGLVLHTVTGILTGTPSAATPTTEYTVTAIGADGRTSANLTITVDAAPLSGLMYSTNPASYLLDAPITPNTAIVTGTSTSYTVAPALPAGLTLDAATGAITGTPTMVTAAADYVVTAANASSNTTATLNIAVDMPPSPPPPSYSMLSPWTVGFPIEPLAPTDATGPVTSYSVWPPLPEGLNLDPRSGVITGTPLSIPPNNPEFAPNVVAANAGGRSVGTALGFAIEGPAPSIVHVISGIDAGVVTSYHIASMHARCYALAGDQPVAAAASPNGRFLYVANANDHTVSVLDVRTDGTYGWRAAVGTGSVPADVVVDPTSRYCYVSSSGSNSVSQYTIDPATGDLSEISPSLTLLTGSVPTALAIDPIGRFLYVVLSGTNQLEVHAIDARTGALNQTATDSQTFVGPARGVAAHPTGKFVYVSEGSNHVHGFTIDAATGGLTAIGRSPYIADGDPSSIAITGDGRFLYAVGPSSDVVSQFSIDHNHADGTGTGFLSALTPATVTVGAAPSDIAVCGNAAVVTARDAMSTEVRLMRIAIDGTLSAGTVSPGTPVALVKTRQEPIAVAISPAVVPYVPRSNQLVIASAGSSSFGSYLADAGTGELTQVGMAIPGTPAATATRIGNTPNGNRFAFVAHALGITSFALASDGTVGAGIGVSGRAHRDVILDPSGRFAYGLEVSTIPGSTDVQGYTDLQTYTVDPDSGALTRCGPPITTGMGAVSGAIDPTGRFLYVPNAAQDDLDQFTIDPSTGALTAGATIAATDGPRSAVVHPNGRFLYVCNSVSGDVTRWVIDNTTGAPSMPISVMHPGVGGDAKAIAIDPSGRFLYVANGSSNDVLLFTTDPVNGTPTAATRTTITNGPVEDVRVDASGRFLYVAHADRVTRFAIHPANGTASGGTWVSAGAGAVSIGLSSDGR